MAGNAWGGGGIKSVAATTGREEGVFGRSRRGGAEGEGAGADGGESKSMMMGAFGGSSASWKMHEAETTFS